MSNRGNEPPRVIRANSWKVHEDTLSPGCTFAGLVQGEKQHLGHYFMASGAIALGQAARSIGFAARVT